MLQPLASLKAKVLTMAYKVLHHLASAPTTLFLTDCSRHTGLAVPQMHQTDAPQALCTCCCNPCSDSVWWPPPFTEVSAHMPFIRTASQTTLPSMAALYLLSSFLFPHSTLQPLALYHILKFLSSPLPPLIIICDQPWIQSLPLLLMALRKPPGHPEPCLLAWNTEVIMSASQNDKNT